MAMNTDGLGTRIRHARKKRSMTQAALAKAAHIKQPSLSLLETGETKEIAGLTLVGIAKALRVRPEWLLLNEEPMEPQPGEATTAAERELLEAYRAGTGRWRATLKHMVNVTPERQDEVAEALLVLIAKIAADPVADVKVERAFGSAAKKARL